MIANIKNKKGQSLPMETIVIAILVVAVLAFLLYFFLGGVGSTSQDIDELKTGEGCTIDNPIVKAQTGEIDQNQLTTREDIATADRSTYKKILGIESCWYKK